MNYLNALRLVVYIRAIGPEPVWPNDNEDCETYLSRLEEQWAALVRELGESEVMWARATGLAAIQSLGLWEAADPFPTFSTKPNTSSQTCCEE
jgi:hypothetical protein